MLDTVVANVRKHAALMGMDAAVEFDLKLLNPQSRIRSLCSQDKCGNFRKHYMCPPYIGSIEDIGERLAKYHRGILLQRTTPLDVKNDREGLVQSKKDFHELILQLEDYCKNLISLRGKEVEHVWGLIGGTCELCHPCKAAIDEPCPYTERARPSLEALAIDVVDLCKRYNLDYEFHPDKITWTGALLLRGR